MNLLDYLSCLMLDFYTEIRAMSQIDFMDLDKLFVNCFFINLMCHCSIKLMECWRVIYL